MRRLRAGCPRVSPRGVLLTPPGACTIVQFSDPLHAILCMRRIQEPEMSEQTASTASAPRVDYQTDPSQYRHWKLSFEGQVATLAMDVAEDAGLRPGYKLKLNSYDLGVDTELHDAVNRIRFEHPEVRTVI